MPFILHLEQLNLEVVVLSEVGVLHHLEENDFALVRWVNPWSPTSTLPIHCPDAGWFVVGGLTRFTHGSRLGEGVGFGE